MQVGIYLITCSVPDCRPRYYVGQTSCLKKRVSAHVSRLKSGKHHNRKMQGAWSKYGQAAFKFELIEECEPSLLDGCEQWWLAEMVGHASVFNIGTDPGAFMRGRSFSDEHRAKISKALTGIKRGPMSDDLRKLVGDRFRGKTRSLESRQKQAASQSGPKHYAFGKTGAQSLKAKKVVGVSIDTGHVINLNFLADGAGLGFSPDKISKCCNGWRPHHRRYAWRFA